MQMKLIKIVINKAQCLVSPVLWLTSILLILSLAGCNMVGILNPKGLIAYEERKLFFDTLALMLIVVLPVIIMSFTFVYHYQVSHRIKEYRPNWSHSYFLESLWWGIPCFIILVLAVLTWKKTHELDPYNKISGVNQNPLLIQAIALPWKWLFIYPAQNIATINFLMIPVGQQVEFWMTTDNVPMSAFMIPQLGSQIYTMGGMRSRLYLLANHPGDYDGLNTQFNGDGFSDMHFTVRAVDSITMQQWITQMKTSLQSLTNETYLQLLRPTMGDRPQFFSGVEKDLFQQVVHLYMHSQGTTHPREQQANFNTNINHYTISTFQEAQRVARKKSSQADPRLKHLEIKGLRALGYLKRQDSQALMNK